MHPSERENAFPSAYTAHTLCTDGFGTLRTRAETVQQNQQPQQLPTQQAQLQQHRLSLDTPSLADQPSQVAASVPCLQPHDRDCGHPQQQHGKSVLSQQYLHYSQQQQYGAQAGADRMGAGGAGQAIQMLPRVVMATANPRSQQQVTQVPEHKVLADEQPHVQPDLAPLVDHSAHHEDHQHQQQLHLWQQELSAAQRNPFLQVLQQQRQQQQLNGTSSAATTATNTSAFASAAADTGGSSGGGGGSSGGGSSAGGSTSGGGAGRALITGRTVTGELPVIPQGFDIAQAAAPAAAAAGGASLEQQASRHLSADRGLAGPATAITPAATVSGQSSQQQQAEEPVVLRHTRHITCKTYLKRLNVTQYMSDHLLPSMEGSLRVSSQKMQAAFTAAHGSGRGSGHSQRQHGHGRSRAAAAAAGSDDEYDPHSRNAAAAGAAVGVQRSAGGNAGVGSGQRSYEMLFKVAVKLVDSVGQVWPVTYEGVLCAGQRHLRLTCGWSEFIKAKKIIIGDSITFETRGGNRTALAVAIQKPGQEPEQMWAGQLPADEQIRVLVGSLRGGAAAGGDGQGAAVSGGHGMSPPGRPPLQQQQLLRAMSGGAARRGGGIAGGGRQGRRGGSRNSSKKRRQRDDTDDDDDWDDRGHEASYDDVSSGSTAVTDSGAAAASSGSGLGSTGAVQGFGPAVQGLEALRVDSLSGRSGQAFAAAAAAVAVVDAAAAAAAAAAQTPAAIAAGYGRGKDRLGAFEPGLQLWQQQQHQQQQDYWDTRAPVASAAAAVAAGISAAAMRTDGCISHPDAVTYQQQLTGLQQQQRFPRRLRQRQQQAGLDVQYSDCPASSGSSEGLGGQGSLLRDYQHHPAAASVGRRLLGEWAAGDRLAATESVQSHELQQQQYSHQLQQQHSQHYLQHYQQQQYSGSSRDAPAPVAEHVQPPGGAAGSSARYQGWQVSTGFGAGGTGSYPAVSRFGSAISQHQGLSNQRAVPGSGRYAGSQLPAGSGSAGVAHPTSGGGGLQVLERMRLHSALSQSQQVLEQQQSTVRQSSLLPASSGSDLADCEGSMYQQSRGYQQLYAGSRFKMEPADESNTGSLAAVQGQEMGPPRSVWPQAHQQQQQRDAWHQLRHMHTSALERLTQPQQQQQNTLVDFRGSDGWLLSGHTQQQLHQQRALGPPKTDYASDADCSWDADLPLPPSTTQQLQQQQQQQQPPPPYVQACQQQQQLQQFATRRALHQWQVVEPVAAEQIDDAWDGAMVDTPTAAGAATAPASLPRPWQQRQQFQGQLLESAGASTDVGSIGAMESVELVDTLLQLLGTEQAAEQQQQTAATASLLTQEEQQQLAEAAAQVVQAECLQYAANQQQDQQQQLRSGPGAVVLQQWHQEQGQPTSDRPQLTPPILLPMQAELHHEQQ